MQQDLARKEREEMSEESLTLSPTKQLKRAVDRSPPKLLDDGTVRLQHLFP
jgi:hypothetical protein